MIDSRRQCGCIRGIRVSLLVASLLLIGVGAGCGDGDDDGSPEPRPVLYRTDVLGGDAALLEGVLDLDGVCLVIETAGGERVLPFFPEATTEWDADEQVLSFEGEKYGLGDTMSLGGSGDDLSERLDRFDFASPPDPSCDVTRAWVVPRSR